MSDIVAANQTILGGAGVSGITAALIAIRTLRWGRLLYFSGSYEEPAPASHRENPVT